MKNNQFSLLLERSRELFMRHGVKSLTMDDIARELGMSKKTIYQYVDNKSELVQLTLEGYLNEERDSVTRMVTEARNSVDCIIVLVSYFLNQTREFNPYVLNDLQRYYPASWNVLNEYRYNYFKNIIAKNIEEGIKEGLYRPDLDADVISKIYIKGFEILLDQELFPQKDYVFVSVYKEFLNYHLRGIVSQKGLKLLEEHNIFKT
ncbi:MAG: TetR/AcrR family transcriptional regulator [Chitinophagales bacterium]